MRTITFAVMTLLIAFFATGLGPAKAETRLIMFGEEWCEWCKRWEADIGGIYHNTAEGKRAPLVRADIGDPVPDGVVLNSRASFTPTFVLVEDGHEVGRIEGYPGEDFFWGLLNQLMQTLPPEPAKGPAAGA